MEKIKNCNICKSEAEKKEKDGYVKIECKNQRCKASVTAGSEEEALRLWNKE